MVKYAKPTQLNQVPDDAVLGLFGEELKRAESVTYGKSQIGLFYVTLTNKKGEQAVFTTSKRQTVKIEQALKGVTDAEERENTVVSMLADCSIIEVENAAGEIRHKLATQGGNSKTVKAAEFIAKAKAWKASRSNVTNQLLF